MQDKTAEQTRSEVKYYYGKTLSTSNDLKTTACVTGEAYPNHIKVILSELSDEVMQKYYGCGLCIPTHLTGSKVLDLGSGSGRDCFIVSKMTGQDGYVVGVDMTAEQLDVANNNIEYHMKKFNYQTPNVSFVKGELEQLDALELTCSEFNVAISNCVINLVADKQKVIQNVYDRLSEGGEFYFSDVYCDRKLPDELIKDPVLYGECLSGALYWNDFLNIAKSVGFADPRLVSSSEIAITDSKIKEKLGSARFFSATYRLFKLKNLEPDCEDYGQAIVYNGDLPESPNFFKLDDHHIFETGNIYSVCGNTYRMLNETRLKSSFKFHGDFETHFGIFPDCGKPMPFNTSVNIGGEVAATSCC